MAARGFFSLGDDRKQLEVAPHARHGTAVFPVPKYRYRQISELAEPLNSETGSACASFDLLGRKQPMPVNNGDLIGEKCIHPARLCVLPHIRQEGNHASPGDADDAIVGGVAEPKSIVRGLIQQMLAVSGLTLTRLARQANLSPSTLTKFVNDQSDDIPSTRTILKLAEATGLELSVLPSRPEARPDPEMLRLAILLALRHVPQDEPDREAELARVGTLTYDVLAESKEEGRPITQDAAALAFIESLMRRFLARR